MQSVLRKWLQGVRTMPAFLIHWCCALFPMPATRNTILPIGFPGITATEVVSWLNLATGMEQDFTSLMKAGEKIFNLKHLINLRRGLDSASDCLHERFVTVKKNYGPAAEHLPPVTKMVADYYRIRGWEADGKIKPEKAAALGLTGILS